MYIHRTYRKFDDSQRLLAFQVAIQETDLYIKARIRLEEEAYQLIHIVRKEIESYISVHPDFKESLSPLPDDESAPAIVQEMLTAGRLAGVGPMAGVAGAIAEYVGKGLLIYSPEIIVENGGDIFVYTQEPLTIEIFAGASPLSGKLGIVLQPSRMPLGICTSSGTVGPSLSFGRADAVTIVSPSPTLADAVATAVGNLINDETDIGPGLEQAQSVSGVSAALVIYRDRMGAWGDMELVAL